MTRALLTTLALSFAVVVGAQGAIAERHGAGERPVPSCQEDQTLVGTGDFVSGRWTGYRCGSAVDDIPLVIDLPDGTAFEFTDGSDEPPYVIVFDDGTIEVGP